LSDWTSEQIAMAATLVLIGIGSWALGGPVYEPL